MQTATDQAAAILIILGIILGSVLFLVAAVLPTSRVFTEPSPEKKLALIDGSRRAWAVALVLFGLAAVLAAVGVAIVAIRLPDPTMAWIGYLTAVTILAGALAWAWHLCGRIVDPAAFAHGPSGAGAGSEVRLRARAAAA